jgi:hypothetical protein
MTVACWCLAIVVRETDQPRRDGYESRGNEPDEERGEEVVPFGDCPEADEHLHIRGQAAI